MRDFRGNEKRQDALLARAASRAGNAVPIPNGFWQQSTLWVDPQNRTGLASNNNDGLLATDPIRNWSEAFRRYGTQFPNLPNGVDIHFMSSSPADGSDPVIFNPTLTGFFPLRFDGTFDAHNLVGSGILAGVVPKNRATGQTLEANVSSVPGATVGRVLVNTTGGKSSRSILRRDLGGGLFQLTQPLTISDIWPTTGDPLEVNSYANGDTFQLYNEDLVDFVQLQPYVARYEGLQANEFTVVTNLGIMNTSPGVTNALYLGDCTAFSTSWMNRRIIMQRSVFNRNALFFGCLGSFGMRGGPIDVQIPSDHVAIFGGAYNSLDLVTPFLDGDVVMQSGFTRLSGGFIGAACIEGAIQFQWENQLGDGGNGAALWGAGSLNVTGAGRLFLNGTTAVASLLLSGGIQINGQNFGFTATRANPSVVNGAVAITPANIDAAASGMFQPGGGGIANFG